ncbi:MAG: porin, partial [Octadecabacter sp.]
SIDLEDLAGGQDSGDESDASDSIDFELSLTHDMGGIYYGDTSFAAENLWTSAGDMEADGFSEQDGEEVLRGEVMYGGVTAQMSYVLGNNDGAPNASEELNQLSLAVSADLGNFNVVAAYQDASDEVAGFYDNGSSDNGDFNDAEVFGLSVGTSFSGADVRLAYADNSDDTSVGVQVSYPFGPVTATVYYVAEDSDTGSTEDNYGMTLAYANGPVAVTLDYDNDQTTDKVGIEGSYDVGNGLTVYAGALYNEGATKEDAYYVAGEYDLGSGASVLVSYAEGDADEYEDEIGAGDYQSGTTVELSFEF